MKIHQKTEENKEQQLHIGIEYHEVDDKIYRRIKQENGTVYWQKANWTTVWGAEHKALENIRQEENKQETDPLENNLEYQTIAERFD